MPRRAFTEEEATHLRHQYEQGADLKDLARRTGRTPTTIASAIRRVGGTIRKRGRPDGTPRPPGGEHWTPEEVKRWRVYRLTPADYQRLLKRAGGRCEVCGSLCDAPEIDHCHGTGKVRGLVCHPCNIRIGHLEQWTPPDFPEKFKDVIAFLRRHDPLFERVFQSLARP